MRVSSEFIDQHLTGVQALEFLVTLPDDEVITAPATVRQVLAFSRWLRAQPGITAVLSPWEPLRGVPAALLPKLFTPFFKHGEHSGHGLGLAIAKKSIQRVNGVLDARNCAPNGLLVCIELPGKGT